MGSHSGGHLGRRLGVVGLTGLTLVSAACASAGRHSPQPVASVVFSNETPDHAAVYVVLPGVELRRIGTVIPGRTETLTIPADLAARGSSLNIVARLLARRERPQTGPIVIHPGDRYEVRLTSDTRMLSFVPAGS